MDTRISALRSLNTYIVNKCNIDILLPHLIKYGVFTPTEYPLNQVCIVI